MDEIRPWLFIGGFRDTLDKGYLDRKRIQAMLQIAEPVQHEGINSLFLEVDDLARTPHHLIKQGVDFVLTEKEMGHNILVSCGAGVNRSTMFCLAALKEAEGLNLFDAFKEVVRRHPGALPNEQVWEAFCDYYHETVPYLNVMRLAAKNF